MFRTVLKELRELNKDTQATLAIKLGVTKGTVSNWEQGKCEPKIVQLCRICDLYKVSADYLLGRIVDDRTIRKRRFEGLSEDNQRFVIKMENLLLNDQQQRGSKK